LHLFFQFCFYTVCWFTTIITTYAFNNPKRIMPNVSPNIKSEQMKGNQVRKNNGKQVISITTQIIKHGFIWRIIYKQNVPNMVLRNFKKKASRLLWNTCFSRLVVKKWLFFWDNFCPRTLEGSKIIYVCSLVSFRYLSMS